MAAQTFEITLANGVAQRPFRTGLTSSGVAGDIYGQTPTPLLPLSTGLGNFLAEKTGLVKRPGFDGVFLAPPPAANKVGEGIWSAQSSIYSLYNGAFYRDTTQVGTLSSNPTFLLSSLSVSPLPGANIISLLVTGNSGLFNSYTYVGGTFAVVADAFYATLNLVPGTACLDGTFYVMDTTGAIYGSETINDPTVWDATNRVTAWGDSSYPVGLAQYKNYLIAFKQTSCQFFYDAGNALGSPLLPLPLIQSVYGCATFYSVATVGDSLFWVGTMNGENYVVCQLNNLTVSVISTPDVVRILADYNASSFFIGCAVLFHGHPCYVINLSQGRLLYYDLTTGLWDFILVPVSLAGINGSVPVAARASSIVVQTTVGQLLYMNPTAFQDTLATGVIPIVSEVITPKMNCGTMTTKVCETLKLVADRNLTGFVDVCWSDDDMSTWSTWQRIDMKDEAMELRDLGSFVQRHWRFRHTAAAPVGLQLAYVECRVGST
jgi:hypothetical protein